MVFNGGIVFARPPAWRSNEDIPGPTWPREDMMYRKRFVKLFAGAVLVISMLAVAAGGAFAGGSQAPGPTTRLAPCYQLVREDLGTVLPSGWRGEAEASTCSQAAADLAAGRNEAMPVALRGGQAASPAGASACTRNIRADLGTVLPGYESGITLAEICAATADAQAVSR
jgi:hypothetical protein